MTRSPCGGLAFAASLFSIAFPIALARSQETQLPPIVVTATRTPLPMSEVGSDVTVITAQEIERSGATSLNQLLLGVPGVDIHDAGGAGTATTIALRGASAGETLFLIDGVRVGDPSSVDGSFNLGNIGLEGIERIEVLRGPQSALYGSDAMGGVVDIITKKGSSISHGSVTLSGGSYGTEHSSAYFSGTIDRWSYSFALDALHADGFSRFGYRVKGPILLSDGVTPLPPLPKDDPTTRAGANARLTYRLTEDVTIEGGVNDYENALRFDNPYAFAAADVFSKSNWSKTNIGSGFLKATSHSFGGRLHSQFTLFDSQTRSDISETESCSDFVSTCVSFFRGDQFGAEYQGDLKEGGWAITTFGLRSDTERAHSWQVYSPDFGGAYAPGFGGRQTIRSAYLLQQAGLGDLDLSLGGRADAVAGGPTFFTYRGTAAYRIRQSGTKLRASLGSGAKEPTLYQRFGPYGDVALSPERNLGADMGLDQSVLDGRALLSATAFWSAYRNLIGFANAPSCKPSQPFGCYYNVGRARAEGVELSARATLIPGSLLARASYTRLIALDLETRETLLQHARDTGALSLAYIGIPRLDLEGKAVFVGARYDASLVGTRAELKPYMRLDADASYKMTSMISLFARLENITDVRYQEAFDYGTPGRSIYGGVKLAW